MPFVRQDLLQDGNNELFVLLSNQQSWLLKTIAIEVKMASQTRLRSSMTRILDALYGQQTAQPSGTVEPFRGTKSRIKFVGKCVIEKGSTSKVTSVRLFCNRPFSYSENESQSNDTLLHFVEFSNVHNRDRSSNATRSNLVYENV